jgi:hypothetical protein
LTDDSKRPPALAAVPDLPETDLPEPTDEEVIETMTQCILLELPIAHAFVPSFPADRMHAIAMFLAKEQHMINTEILPRLLDPNGDKSHIILRFTTMPQSEAEANQSRPGVRVEAPRNLEGSTDPGEAMSSGMVFAFLQSPVSRAMLRMAGFTYEFSFGDSEGPSNQPLVLLK